MERLLKNLFEKYQIEYNQEMLSQLNKFYEMVIETNKVMNLTAITDKNEFAIKHILDSVLPIEFIPKNASVIDIGAGAGFPSIPLKILRPDLTVVMVDSLNKRVEFLQDVINKLSLTNISAFHFRAEDFIKNNREKFDVALARAVALLPTLCEYCMPYVKLGGIFIAYKGQRTNEEISLSQNALNILGGKIEQIQKVNIFEINSLRENLIIKKIKETPTKYPRSKNLPKDKPL